MTAAFEPIQMLSKMPFPEVMRMSLMGSTSASVPSGPARSGWSPRWSPATT